MDEGISMYILFCLVRKKIFIFFKIKGKEFLYDIPKVGIVIGARKKEYQLILGQI